MKLSLLLSQMGVEMLVELEIKKEKFDRDIIDNYYARGYNQAIEEISNLEVPEQKVLSVEEIDQIITLTSIKHANTNLGEMNYECSKILAKAFNDAMVGKGK